MGLSHALEVGVVGGGEGFMGESLEGIDVLSLCLDTISSLSINLLDFREGPNTCTIVNLYNNTRVGQNDNVRLHI